MEFSVWSNICEVWPYVLCRKQLSFKLYTLSLWNKNQAIRRGEGSCLQPLQVRLDKMFAIYSQKNKHRRQREQTIVVRALAHS